MTIIKMHGAPDQHTRGEVGDMYIDLDTTSVYICAEVHPDKIAHNGYISVYTRDTANTEYVWELIGSTGEDAGPVGQWLPMAADGVSCMGEAVTIGGENTTPYQIELLASNTNQYRVILDGDEYSAYVDNGKLVLEGYSGKFKIGWTGEGTARISDTSHLSNNTHNIRLERWVE